MRSNRRLFLTADRSEVVPDGDPRGAFLLVCAGGELSDAEARRYGLLAPQADPPPPDPEQVPDWAGKTLRLGGNEPEPDQPDQPEQSEQSEEPAGDPLEPAAAPFAVGDPVRFRSGAVMVRATVEAVLADGSVKIDKRREPLPAASLERVELTEGGEPARTEAPETKHRAGPAETK